MNDPSLSVEARYAAIRDALRDVPGVTDRTDNDQPRRAFGASALKINNKIFAMVSSRGQFVVKLPRQRVEALIASGDGMPFDPGHGRVMKEWVCVEPEAEEDWLALTREAMAFVGRGR